MPGEDRRMRQRAHPRSRGENRPAWVGLRLISGSSPLTRGKFDGGGRGEGRCGLIPAHAGKIRASEGPRIRPRAHPRSRGENGGIELSGVAGWGSSPLTRGKSGRQQTAAIRTRLIPAHAGKMLRSRKAWGPPWAHPRSRGENAVVDDARVGQSGSSPLTRGKSYA